MRPYVLVLLAIPLYAQPVSIGVKVGVPFDDPTGRGESRPFTFGPTVEVQLPAGFAIEGSALYRRLGRTESYSYLTGTNLLSPDLLTNAYNNRIRGNAWDFSILPKYYFGSRRARWQPFFGTGWTLRTIGQTMQGYTTVTGPSGTTTYPFETHSRARLAVGATAAVGVRLRTGRVSWVPELRYTRWGGDTSSLGPIHRNEGGVFLGIRF